MCDKLSQNDLLRYTWDYFHFHASQRLTTFNFYLVLCGFMVAGYASALGQSDGRPVAVLLGLTLSLISFVFRQLDLRNRQLIKNAEEALKELEGKFDSVAEGSPVRIFRYEEYKTPLVDRGSLMPRCLPRGFTFSVCFGIVFWTFAILGIIATAYAVFK